MLPGFTVPHHLCPLLQDYTDDIFSTLSQLQINMLLFYALIMQIDYGKVSPSSSGAIDFMMTAACGGIIVAGVVLSAWVEFEDVFVSYANENSMRKLNGLVRRLFRTHMHVPVHPAARTNPWHMRWPDCLRYFLVPLTLVHTPQRECFRPFRRNA